MGIAATLVYVLYERCFGWSMDLHVDRVILAQGIALAVGAALLTPGSTPPAGPPGARRPRYCAMTERDFAFSSTAKAVLITLQGRHAGNTAGAGATAWGARRSIEAHRVGPGRG